MKPHVTSFSIRRAAADLDEPNLKSDTAMFASITAPGESNDPEAILLAMRFKHHPGVQHQSKCEEWRVDLRAEDFRYLLATLEAAIVEAELAGILPRPKDLPPLSHEYQSEGQ
jgi:hypothetical protein